MVLKHDLWNLVAAGPSLDPRDLAEAIAHEAEHENLDYRTRLLIHESAAALRRHWGNVRYAAWLSGCSQRQRLQAIAAENFDEVGFPSLQDRLMDKLEPAVIRQYLRELSRHVHQPLRIRVGGSGALILAELLERGTEDLDIVDEVPVALRGQHALLHDFKKRYGLYLAHFQSHYLPRGWEARVHSLEPFGPLQVDFVDAYDVFLSKLFSRREKDRDDLRVLAPQLARNEIERRLRDHCGELAADAALRQNAVDNWFILYGDALPT